MVKSLFSRYILTALLAATIVAAFGIAAYAKTTPPAAVKQLTFGSPKKAFDALVNAAAGDNTKQLLAILGPDGKDLVSSGDAVEDTYGRQHFAKAASRGVKFKKLDKKTVLVIVGKDGWTFPIPIVRAGRSWVFFTEEGKQEILDRRIGRNELNTIQTSQAYVEAQREYAEATRGKEDGFLHYAQYFVSHGGSQDGLYWPGKQESPMGELFARAGYDGGGSGHPAAKPVPYYGYYFKILKSQGPHAPGGTKDYMVNGKMTGGFGLLAYPAKYGVSGIMTFIVNQQGILYEKDLGPKTEELAKDVNAYDPDKTWRKVELTEAAIK